MTTVSNSQDTMLDREDLREFLAVELELPAEQVTDDAQFAADLGVDSLIAMEIIVQLEKRYGVQMDESELAEITSLNSVYNLLAGKLQAG
jgi:acyl carrier protein